MRKHLALAILALAVAGFGCTKNDSSSAATDTDATGVAKSSDEGATCPHHKGGKMHGDKMAEGKAHDCAMHEGKECDMMHDGKPCDMMHDGKPCDMAGEMHGKMHGKMHGDMAGKMHGPMDPAAHAAKLTEVLGLDADQKAKAEAIFTEFAPRQQALRDRTLAIHQGMDKSKDGPALDEQAIAAKKAEFAEVRSEKEKLHQELQAALDPILTPEQKARFQEMKAKHHGDKDGERDGHACDGTCDCGAHADSN